MEKIETKIEKNRENMVVRKAARVVLVNEDGLVSIISVRDGEYYKIPGGGIEGDENVEVAAKRETIEEVGYDVEILEEIGEQEYVDPEDENKIHHSICFLGKVLGKQEVNLSEHESRNKFKASWVTFDEAEKLFESVKTEDPYGKKMNERDWKFLKQARAIFEGKK